MIKPQTRGSHKVFTHPLHSISSVSSPAHASLCFFHVEPRRRFRWPGSPEEGGNRPSRPLSSAFIENIPHRRATSTPRAGAMAVGVKLAGFLMSEEFDVVHLYLFFWMLVHIFPICLSLTCFFSQSAPGSAIQFGDVGGCNGWES